MVYLKRSNGIALTGHVIVSPNEMPNFITLNKQDIN